MDAPPMHRRYIGDTLAVQRDPSTPPTWTPYMGGLESHGSLVSPWNAVIEVHSGVLASGPESTRLRQCGS
eukprot:3823383-Pyramimonas_sp.AAC.1